jgi:hypothetical protein
MVNFLVYYEVQCCLRPPWSWASDERTFFLKFDTFVTLMEILVVFNLSIPRIQRIVHKDSTMGRLLDSEAAVIFKKPD